MKRKIITTLASLALIVTLIGCKPKANVEDEYGEDEVAEELTLPTGVT